MDTTESGSERALLTAARRGDRDALETLVTRYEPRVYRFGLSLCRDRDDADDVLQDTFLSMVRSLQRFRGDSSLSTWLFAIAHHACLKRRRRRVSSPRAVESLDALSPTALNTLVAPGLSPEASAAATERHESLQAAIGALDVGQRKVLLLRDVEGLTAPDTAKALGLSVAAVKSRLHRARAAVQQALAPFRSSVPPSSTCAQCRDVALAFSKHLEGDLLQARCAELQAHVATCATCHAVCDSLKEALVLCRTAAPDVPAETRQVLREAVRACLIRAPDEPATTTRPRPRARAARGR